MVNPLRKPALAKLSAASNIMSADPGEAFRAEIFQSRKEWEELLDRIDSHLPRWIPVNGHLELINDVEVDTTWYENGQVVRLFNIPGTLSGDILRLTKYLPDRDDNFEIEGDVIRAIDDDLPEPPECAEDFEDISDLVAQLPLVDVDEDEHFVKQGHYRSEIHNLLKCQGGSCPGQPLSPYIVQLLGRSSKGELVFPKLEWIIMLDILPQLEAIVTLSNYKRWLTQLISALRCLHSLGIIHRDLKEDNILLRGPFSGDGENIDLVLIDIEGRYGQVNAPEIGFEDSFDKPFSEKSDIYELGTVIQGLLYGRFLRSRWVEMRCPKQFQDIIDACKKKDPAKRPTLDELEEMVKAIGT